MCKTILIDFDSVLNNLLDAWVEYLNSRYKLSVEVADIVEWDMTKAFPSLTAEQVFEPLYMDEFWKHVKPLPGAHSTLKKIDRDGFKWYIVTDSNYQTLESKMTNCLLKYFGDLVRPDNVIVTSHKELIECDYIIDDYEQDLKYSKGYRILIDKPYNSKADVYTYDFRASDIIEAYELIKFKEGLTCTK